MPVATATTASTKRIVIVDDSSLVRMGLKSVLESAGEEGEFAICGESDRAHGAIDLIADLKPDLVILDIRLPDGHGFDVCRSITATLPETKVLMLTAFTSDTFVYESITAGAHGYLMKEIEPEKLIQSIREVMEGKSVLSELITHKVMRMMRAGGPEESVALGALSDQERRVLAFVSDGLTNKEIAAQMALSDNTVKNYLASVFSKLKVKRRSQAATIWTENQRP